MSDDINNVESVGELARLDHQAGLIINANGNGVTGKTHQVGPESCGIS